MAKWIIGMVVVALVSGVVGQQLERSSSGTPASISVARCAVIGLGCAISTMPPSLSCRDRLLRVRKPHASDQVQGVGFFRRTTPVQPRRARVSPVMTEAVPIRSWVVMGSFRMKNAEMTPHAGNKLI